MVPAGSTAHPLYASPQHTAQIGYRIYLPPSYASQPQRVFPLIMVLPGYGSTEIWSVSDDWLISAMIEGDLPEAVIVHLNPIGNSFWHDEATSTGTTQTVQGYGTVLNELLPHLLATYRIGDRPEERALIGFSMGGYGAFNLALRSGQFHTVLCVDGSLRVFGNESPSFQYSCGNNSQSIASHNIFAVLAGNSMFAPSIRHMILVASPNFNDHLQFHQQVTWAGAMGSYEYLPDLPHVFDEFVAARGASMLSHLVANMKVPALRIPIKLMIQGAYVQDSTLMRADLTAQQLVPLTEPYSGAGYVFENGSTNVSTTQAVLDRTGADAVVDWVLVELRDTMAGLPVISAQTALLLRNGQVVAPDGSTSLRFNMQPGTYMLGVRHRNHLRACTAVPAMFWQLSDTVDLTSPDMLFAGDTMAVAWCGEHRCLWAGDINGNGTISYSGPANDRDAVLFSVGGQVPTNTAAGYFPEDLNLDGVVRYSGQDNDRDRILISIGGAVPTLTRTANP